MNMSVKEAVRIASKWVCVEVLGERCYRVNYWDALKGVWHEGPEVTSRANALKTAWESKVRITFKLLGVKDAEGLAHSLYRKNNPNDWRHSVREGLRIAESRKLEV
jgi:hypothetical protein